MQLHGVWWIYLLGHIIGAFLGAGVSSVPDSCACILGPCIHSAEHCSCCQQQRPVACITGSDRVLAHITAQL